jgi:hypothetical protein
VQELLDAARDGVGIEGTLKQADLLNRWADWQVEPHTLASTLSGYREATAAAIASFVDGDTGAIDLWRPVRRRNEPLLALVRELGTHGRRCRELPAGWPGELARLLTPLDHQPFAAQRHASLLLGALEAAIAEGNAAEESLVCDLLDAQLRRDLAIAPDR